MTKKKITPPDQVTQKMVKEAFDYDEQSGLLTWARDRGQAKQGQVAGYIKDGYRVVRYASRDYYAHRIIWLWVTGAWPTKVIDHRDRDKLNNKFRNFRDVSHKINSENMSFSKANTSGFRGVYPSKGKFIAKLWFIDTFLKLGVWDTKEDADLAYRACREALGMDQTPEHVGLDSVLIPWIVSNACNHRHTVNNLTLTYSKCTIPPH